MSIWTVETWRIHPDRESHFLEHCAGLVPDDLTLFRDLETPGLFWSPTQWETRESPQAWQGGGRYASCIQAISEDVIEHTIHLMEAVEGFLPRPSRRE